MKENNTFDFVSRVQSHLYKTWRCYEVRVFKQLWTELVLFPTWHVLFLYMCMKCDEENWAFLTRIHLQNVWACHQRVIRSIVIVITITRVTRTELNKPTDPPTSRFSYIQTYAGLYAHTHRHAYIYAYNTHTHTHTLIHIFIFVGIMWIYFSIYVCLVGICRWPFDDPN